MKISICLSKKGNSHLKLTPRVAQVNLGGGCNGCRFSGGAVSGWCGVVECCWCCWRCWRVNVSTGWGTSPLSPALQSPLHNNIIRHARMQIRGGQPHTQSVLFLFLIIARTPSPEFCGCQRQHRDGELFISAPLLWCRVQNICHFQSWRSSRFLLIWGGDTQIEELLSSYDASLTICTLIITSYYCLRRRPIDPKMLYVILLVSLPCSITLNN